LSPICAFTKSGKNLSVSLRSDTAAIIGTVSPFGNMTVNLLGSIALHAADLFFLTFLTVWAVALLKNKKN